MMEDGSGSELKKKYVKNKKTLLFVAGSSCCENGFAL